MDNTQDTPLFTNEENNNIQNSNYQEPKLCNTNVFQYQILLFLY